jgi:type VI secretion system secreted protein Hcp
MAKTGIVWAGIAAAGATLAVAITANGQSGGGTTLNACSKDANGDLHMVTAGVSCPAGSSHVQWNITGPQGPAGIQGPAGPQGPAGTAVGVGAAPAECRMDVEQAPSTTTFADVDGINGDSQTRGFEHQVDVRGVAFCVDMALATGGSTAGVLRVSDVTITKMLDSASVPLLQRATTGTHIATVTIAVVGSASSAPLQTLKLEDVVVTSLHQRAHGAIATEVVSLHFERLTQTTRFVEPNGSLGPPVSVTYDRAG